MVVFFCNSCGDSLKKKDIEPHWFRCKYQSLSCADCHKDFTKATATSHNQCMTEAERYQGSTYVQKDSNNKGQKKQDSWLQNIQEYVNSGKAGDVSSYLENLVNFSNIPRKKGKFENFVKNCMKIHQPDVISKIWAAIEAANVRKTDSNQNEKKNSLDEKRGIEETDNAQVQQVKKQKTENPTECETNGNNEKEDHESQENAVLSESLKFQWKKTLQEILVRKGNQLPLRKLKKKVMTKYKKTVPEGPQRMSKEDVYEKVDKLIKGNKHMELLEDETVQLKKKITTES